MVEGREHLVDVAAIALERVVEVLTQHAVALQGVVGGIDQSDEFVIALHDDTFVDEHVSDEFLLDFLAGAYKRSTQMHITIYTPYLLPQPQT